MRRIFALILSAVVLALLVSCDRQPSKDADVTKASRPEWIMYENPIFGFAVKYPSSWGNNSQQEKDRWGIVDAKKNAILFMAIPNPDGESLEQLAIDQAAEDMGGQVDEEKIKRAISIIEVNNKTWYTYGIAYRDKKLESIVSGTECGENTVDVILVANEADYNMTKETYTKVLESFECR